MTDEQIIKALKCCSDLECSSCTECPLFMVGKECPIVLHSNALALIKRLREEKDEQFRRLGNEIYVHCSKIVDLQERLAFERAEAIREFAKRLYAKEDKAACAVSVYDIRDTVRELTEEQK